MSRQNYNTGRKKTDPSHFLSPPSSTPMDVQGLYFVSFFYSNRICRLIAPRFQHNGHTLHIPIEIIDEILDYLRSDKSCLRRCALISRCWTSSCRRHTFGRVTLEGPSDFMGWSNSFPATPNGPHPYTRALTISNRHLEKECYGSPELHTRFLKLLPLFCNVQDLTIECSGIQRTIDNISIPQVFGHLFGTLRSLSVRRAFCSSQALVSLVASFHHLERLELEGIWFTSAEIPRSLPERRTFKGVFHFTDWDDSSEEFITLLAEHDPRYHEVSVNGVHWLEDTVWNKYLAKCADHLRRFSILWYENDCERACR
jgi:hypothetical protein